MLVPDNQSMQCSDGEENMCADVHSVQMFQLEGLGGSTLISVKVRA